MIVAGSPVDGLGIAANAVLHLSKHRIVSVRNLGRLYYTIVRDLIE